MTSASSTESRAGTGLTLDRLQVVWTRRKWLALVVFALPFTAGATVVASVPSLYRSTATVLVERQQVPETIVKSTVTSELETRLQTISQEILSRARLEGLINRFGLYTEQRERLTRDALVEQLRRDIKLEVRATGRHSATVAFALSHRGRDPNTVAQVTNTLASFYIEENLKARERQASGTTDFLQAQLNDTKKRLDEQERQVSQFKRRYLGELPQQMTANLASLEALTAQLRLNNGEQVRATERRDTLLSQIGELESATPSPQSSPSLAGQPSAGPEPHTGHLTRLKQELAAARARYTDLHPSVLRLNEELAAAERALAAAPPAARPEIARSEPPPATPAPASQALRRVQEALRSTELELKLIKAEEQRLRSGLADLQTRIDNTPRREQEFYDISRDYETTKELHRSLIKAHESAQLSESMEHRQKGEQFRLLDPAIASAATASPKRERLLLMVLALSLGLAVGVVLLAEQIDTSFHSLNDLRNAVDVPVLVSIPRIPTETDRRRQTFRFRLAAAGAMLGLALVTATSLYVAHGNDRLVRMLDQDRLS